MLTYMHGITQDWYFPLSNIVLFQVKLSVKDVPARPNNV